MRVLQVASLPSGGAFRAMYRLHYGLRAEGIESFCLSLDSGGHPDVEAARSPIGRRLFERLERMPVRWARKIAGHDEFNANWAPGALRAAVGRLKPDVVHLHWVGRSMMQIEDLPRLGVPIVWTLHDFWPLTGGCHVPFDCARHLEGCGACPQLGSTSRHDLSRWVFRRKEKAWAETEVIFVAPSRWIADLACKSHILPRKRVEVVANGMDLEIFFPVDKRAARAALGLDPDASFLLFGAFASLENNGKGFQFLKPTLQEMLRSSKRREPPTLLIMGASKPDSPPDLPIPTHFLGTLRDDISLRIAFSAADNTLVPSLWETFGQMASESLACGTPVVAFGTSGLLDIVEPNINGFLARPFDTTDLGRCLAEALAPGRAYDLSEAARASAIRKFDVAVMAKKHIAIYAGLQGGAPSSKMLG